MDHVVVMAGGSGTRFWPESRARRSMQFLEPAGRGARAGETIRAVAEVKGTDPQKRIVTLETDCYNQDGEPVVKGEAVVLLDPVG